MIKSDSPPLFFSKIDTQVKNAFHKSLKNWFLTHRRELPWRHPRTPYAVTVSEFMLQQTQVKTVIPYFNRWMCAYPDWIQLAKASEQSVLKSWEGLGYYSRARNLHRLAQTISEKFQGKIPSSIDELLGLPGIGRYTAGAIASMAFEKKAPLVDGNVIRLFSRVFACSENVSQPKIIEQFWLLAEKLLPHKEFGIHNESLMELGALICTPKNPQCALCPLQKICQGKESPEIYPNKVRIKSEKKTEKIAIIQKNKNYFIIAGISRQKGFSLFPTFDPTSMQWIKTVGKIKYGFTKYTIEMSYGECRFTTDTLPNGRWISLNRLKSIPLPQAHRKIVVSLLPLG